MRRTPEQVKWDRVQRWLAKSREDLRVARVIMDPLTEAYETVGFHARQAAEKVLKALLICYDIPFPKTHDIAHLLALLSTVDPELGQAVREADDLTPYAADFRYPGEGEATDRETVARLIGLAERVRRPVTDRLSLHFPGGRP